MSTPHVSQAFPDWTTFCSARHDYVTALAETVEKGFLQRDTTHPVFGGCIDWHSSVHGAYALLTAARLTGQSRWAKIVDAALKPDCLALEIASLRRGDLIHELPYGYAWFLKLAGEREQNWGKSDLHQLGSDIVSRLRQWLFTLTDDEVVHHARRREYGNLSWPLLNLWQWGKWKRDLELLDQLSTFARVRLLPLDRECPASLDCTTDEFFPAALQRCRTLLTILSPQEASAWLTAYAYDGLDLSPLTMCSTVHSAGLNFSRSWSLWTLYQHTQNMTFRDLYVDHIVTHMNRPQYWRDGYRMYGHWVPQFGIYAIALSIEDAQGN